MKSTDIENAALEIAVILLDKARQQRTEDLERIDSLEELYKIQEKDAHEVQTELDETKKQLRDNKEHYAYTKNRRDVWHREAVGWKKETKKGDKKIEELKKQLDVLIAAPANVALEEVLRVNDKLEKQVENLIAQSLRKFTDSMTEKALISGQVDVAIYKAANKAYEKELNEARKDNKRLRQLIGKLRVEIRKWVDYEKDSCAAVARSHAIRVEQQDAISALQQQVKDHTMASDISRHHANLRDKEIAELKKQYVIDISDYQRVIDGLNESNLSLHREIESITYT